MVAKKNGKPGANGTPTNGNLANRFGDRLRYAVEWKDWIVWNGRRWRRDCGGIEVQAMARAVVNNLWQDVKDSGADHRELRQMAAFAAASNTAKGAANAVTLARSSLPVAVDRLDADPWLLNVANGTLDLRTGRLRKPYQWDYLTKLCPTEYDPAAPCPVWERFLTDVFRGTRN